LEVYIIIEIHSIFKEIINL